MNGKRLSFFKKNILSDQWRPSGSAFLAVKKGRILWAFQTFSQINGASASWPQAPRALPLLTTFFCVPWRRLCQFSQRDGLTKKKTINKNQFSERDSLQDAHAHTRTHSCHLLIVNDNDYYIGNALLRLSRNLGIFAQPSA